MVTDPHIRACSSKLEDNGFTHVTVLTFANDYDTARAYPIWLKEMEAKGATLEGTDEETRLIEAEMREAVHGKTLSLVQYMIKRSLMAEMNKIK